ncbi:MAG: PIN domain-containing protein [Candidatus Paceibacterota bacterium]|jgi:hypothetical protein
METSKNKKIKYIFIDTNLFHGVFVSKDLCEEVLPILEKLSDNNYEILLPQQVIDEINRNRFTSWLKPLSINKFTNLRDIVLGDAEGLKGVKGLLGSIEQKVKSIQKENNRRVTRLTTIGGQSSKTINRLVKICKIIPDSNNAMSATRMRVAKGNPPLETDKVKKDCDRYIWELLLEYFSNNSIRKPYLYFFTKNYTDWCIDVSGKKVFNPFLTNEFAEKFSGNIKWFDNLKFLPNTTSSEMQAVQKEVKEFDQSTYLQRVESAIADKLRNSNTWADSDKIMKLTAPFIEKFSAKTIINILKAAKENLEISSGPFNQVLDASNAVNFFDKLFKRSLGLKMPLAIWKEFYCDLDENQQEKFINIRQALEKKGVQFNFSEIKYFTTKDIPF